MLQLKKRASKSRSFLRTGNINDLQVLELSRSFSHQVMLPGGVEMQIRDLLARVPGTRQGGMQE